MAESSCFDRQIKAEGIVLGKRKQKFQAKNDLIVTSCGGDLFLN